MNPFTITVIGVDGPSWTSPDGKINCFTISFKNNADTLITRETYSKTIAQVGWTGEVIEYAKNTRVYVKQPPREGYENQVAIPTSTVGLANTDRLSSLTERLEIAVEQLENYFRDKPTNAEVNAVTQVLGGEIVDDLP